jgi:hypothetical protein
MLLICTNCTTAYAVGGERCPHCGGNERVEQGDQMPKITVHGGPSNRYSDPRPSDSAAPVAHSEPAQETVEGAEPVRRDRVYHEWTYQQLVSEARRRNLPRKGTVTDLIGRLERHDSEWGEVE